MHKPSSHLESTRLSPAQQPSEPPTLSSPATRARSSSGATEGDGIPAKHSDGVATQQSQHAAADHGHWWAPKAAFKRTVSRLHRRRHGSKKGSKLAETPEAMPALSPVLPHKLGSEGLEEPVDSDGEARDSDTASQVTGGMTIKIADATARSSSESTVLATPVADRETSTGPATAGFMPQLCAIAATPSGISAASTLTESSYDSEPSTSAGHEMQLDALRVDFPGSRFDHPDTASMSGDDAIMNAQVGTWQSAGPFSAPCSPIGDPMPFLDMHHTSAAATKAPWSNGERRSFHTEHDRGSEDQVLMTAQRRRITMHRLNRSSYVEQTRPPIAHSQSEPLGEHLRATNELESPRRHSQQDERTFSPEQTVAGRRPPSMQEPVVDAVRHPLSAATASVLEPSKPVKVNVRNLLETAPSMSLICGVVARHYRKGPPCPSWSLSAHLTVAVVRDVLDRMPTMLEDPDTIGRLRIMWERASRRQMPRRVKYVLDEQTPKPVTHRTSGFFSPSSSGSSSTKEDDQTSGKKWRGFFTRRSDEAVEHRTASDATSTRRRSGLSVPSSPVLSKPLADTNDDVSYTQVYTVASGQGEVHVRTAAVPSGYRCRATQICQSLGLEVNAEDAESLAMTLSSPSTSNSRSDDNTASADESLLDSVRPVPRHSDGRARARQHRRHREEDTSRPPLTAEWVTWHPAPDKQQLKQEKEQQRRKRKEQKKAWQGQGKGAGSGWRSATFDNASVPPTSGLGDLEMPRASSPLCDDERPRQRGRRSPNLATQATRDPSATIRSDTGMVLDAHDLSFASNFSDIQPSQSPAHQRAASLRARAPSTSTDGTRAPRSQRGSHGRPPSVILYLHGGALVAGSSVTHRPLASRLARDTGASLFVLNYRLSPEYAFPAALQDALAAYLYLTDPPLSGPVASILGSGRTAKHSATNGMPHGVSPSRVLLAGDSAGGGLVMALLLALRDADLPLPAGGIGFSPWVDLTGSMPSIKTNGATDYLPMPTVLEEAGARFNLWPGRDHFYATERRLLKSPYVSPMWATDLTGLPPLLVQVGGAERLRDEGIRFAHRTASRDHDGASPGSLGTPSSLESDYAEHRTPRLRLPTTVRLEVYDDMPHVWHCFPNMPANRVSLTRATDFVRACLDAPEELISEHLRIAPTGELLVHESLTSE
ncbi:hypothetical protein THASP1DRAFT_24432 [Thamnocephalis sphaerospora]|uniref:Alpha/beta hydrolase fold-3 domain-containing protein n=1 Tax=Thamnocephalis sphaerospora TaxID=78915 RepID=A0A4P9XNA0_9FUNG|nr:hypothetical protein THASP1DRAFT_24432 [Thamnocephalis sphaerospora]|eukprot:RKP07414.1 hypothetical protein THASP1DRAFT_24432 [Thamnocephalis sphaerospora]